MNAEQYRKIADSDFDFLSKSTLFGVSLVELIKVGLRETQYADVDLDALFQDHVPRPLYVKEVDEAHRPLPHPSATPERIYDPAADA